MATKHQDTLHDQTWTEAAGPKPIAAFAANQWRLGERLSYQGMWIYTAPPLRGAEVRHAVASFADGSIQPIEEAKFIYDCSERAFTHVVISSASAAMKP